MEGKDLGNVQMLHERLLFCVVFVFIFEGGLHIHLIKVLISFFDIHFADHAPIIVILDFGYNLLLDTHFEGLHHVQAVELVCQI